jgi:hypothetical protein
MWAYPIDDGVLLSERGEASISSGWHDSQMEMVAGTMKFGMWSGDGIVSVTSSISTPKNVWHHFTMTHNGTKLIAYVNGQVAGEAIFNRFNPVEGGTGIYYAVAGPDTTSMGDGTYANMRFGGMQVYNVALTASEVDQNFRATRSKYGV